MLAVFWDYIGFLGKVVTVLIAAGIFVAMLAAARSSGKPKKGEGSLKVRVLNDFYTKLHKAVGNVLLSKAEIKAAKKTEAKAGKQLKKEGLSSTDKPKVFVIDFTGDIHASSVQSLRHEVTAVLGHAKKVDEIVLRLESPGGVVDGYGLAASQLVRIRDAGIPLTICVDKIAASGGYMMACLGNKVMCAPFALLGSIGVVSQFPNVHRLLKKHDIDVETITAGEFKRTLTTLGENTEAGREKYKEDLTAIHNLFKGFVSKYRPTLDTDKVATGESWFGQYALDQKLADELKTSDEYLQEKVNTSDVIHIQYELPKAGGLKARLGITMATVLQDALATFANRRIGS
ncbi:serine protease SohB [Pseudomonas frederiksbergensis]|uniref:protease SohB n=1 Tax=Pseudomonas TaxID=286 RepID=UPI003D1CEEB8